jgi:dTDP-4-dehydrorhamnose reductase
MLSRVKALITGSSGTVGSALRRALEAAGWDCTRWRRSVTPIDDYRRMHAFVASERPDVVFHLAAASQPEQQEITPAAARAVNYEWTSELAWITRDLDIRFLFTSTAMVFTDASNGPYTLASQPDADHGYGKDKRDAEERIFHQNPNARIARLGWQIGDGDEGNQMVAWLAKRHRVEASMRWLPACSFLDDTSEALIRIASCRPGLYQIDSNEGWSFYDIACALRARRGAAWELIPTWSWHHDQRLLDPRTPMPSLRERLPELAVAEPEAMW